MIPLKDENPSKTIPIVNSCLILTNFSVFVYQNFFVPGGTGPLIPRLGSIPCEVINAVDLDPKNLVPVPVTLLTSMFVRGGWVHPDHHDEKTNRNKVFQTIHVVLVWV
jgi:membrane associated rhomboid family serine protease